MTHIACRLTVKNWDQLRNPTLGNRVWAIFTFYSKKKPPAQVVMRRWTWGEEMWTSFMDDVSLFLLVFEPEVVLCV